MSHSLTNIPSNLRGFVLSAVQSISTMENLETLPNISQLRKDVIRILGQNPGKFTLQGTNTYLVGQSPPYLLIDTGEGGQAGPPYLLLLEKILKEGLQKQRAVANADGRQNINRRADNAQCLISDVIITHAHRDHFGGIPGTLGLLHRLHNEGWRPEGAGDEYTPPRIHKCLRCPPEFSGSEQFSEMARALPRDLYSPAAAATQDDSGSIIIHHLEDGQIFHVRGGDEGDGKITVLHTPGHTPDSICLLFRSNCQATQEETAGPSPPVLFTGDTVLGQGTSVFDNLNAYLASLNRLAHLGNEHLHFGEIYPGHGPVVEDGPARVREYIAHREQREAEILALLTSGKSPSGQVPAANIEGAEPTYPAWRIWDIVLELYKDNQKGLFMAAARVVKLHLLRLSERGLAESLGGEGVEELWRAVCSTKKSHNTMDEITTTSVVSKANLKQHFHPFVETSALRI